MENSRENRETRLTQDRTLPASLGVQNQRDRHWLQVGCEMNRIYNIVWATFWRRGSH